MSYVKDVFGNDIRVGDACGGTAYTQNPDIERTMLIQNQEIATLRARVAELEAAPDLPGCAKVLRSVSQGFGLSNLEARVLADAVVTQNRALGEMCDNEGWWVDKVSEYKDRATRAEADLEKARMPAVECDKCCCLFIPGGRGAETTCGTCLKAERDEERARVERFGRVVSAARVCASAEDKTAIEAQAAWEELDAALAECGEGE